MSKIPKKLKRDLATNKLKKAKKDLEKISHDYIRRRDSINDYEIKGHCIDCGSLAEGQQFQCGHWQPSGSSGALLRFHPHNMHGQKGGCNTAWQQEKVKIDYTLVMIQRYGADYVAHLRVLKNKTIKADIIFYTTLIELYKEGDEFKIVEYLESL